MNTKTTMLSTLLVAATLSMGASAQNLPTHCRIATIEGEAVKFKIRQASSASQFATPALHYYDITRDWLQYPSTNPSIRIEDNDHFRVAEVSPGVLMLAHTRSGARVAFGQLSLHPSGLWASGPAMVGTGTVVGEYVMYLRPDSFPCQHDNQKGGYCESAHFEYFDLADQRAQSDRPVQGANVVQLGAAETCTNASSQSDEGTGDRGW